MLGIQISSKMCYAKRLEDGEGVRTACRENRWECTKRIDRQTDESNDGEVQQQCKWSEGISIRTWLLKYWAVKKTVTRDTT